MLCLWQERLGELNGFTTHGILAADLTSLVNHAGWFLHHLHQNCCVEANLIGRQGDEIQREWEIRTGSKRWLSCKKELAMLCKDVQLGLGCGVDAAGLLRLCADGWSLTLGWAMPSTSNHGWVEVGVAACMLDQVVAAHEAFGTKRALKTLFACVSAQVTCQLIGAGKFLLTVGPSAWKWSLTCNTHKTHLMLSTTPCPLHLNVLCNLKHGIFGDGPPNH